MSSFPSYQKILTFLSRAKVRFLVAGGIAMNIHGLQRSTADLDLIVFLEQKNLMRFIRVMKKLSFQPKVPVKPEDFADERLRKKWAKEKNMVVFSFRHSENFLEIIDVFVEHPRPFAEMYQARKSTRLSGCMINAVGLEDMLFLKEKAGRPKDEMDIRFLRNILRKKKED